jgi:putative membrane protein
MHLIIQLLLNAAVLLLLAYLMPAVKVRSFGTAVAVALVIGILNATLGALIRFPLNLVTLWLLSFLVRLLVTAIIIRIVSGLFRGFEVKSFSTALIVAVAMAVAGTLFSHLFEY